MTRLYLASVRPLARRFRDTALLDVARTYASRVFAQCVLFVSLKTINVYHTTDYLLALAPSIFMRCALDPDDAGAARGICASSLISSSSPSSHSSGGSVTAVSVSAFPLALRDSSCSVCSLATKCISASNAIVDGITFDRLVLPLSVVTMVEMVFAPRMNATLTSG